MKVALYGRSPKQDDIVYVQQLISEIEQRYPYVIIHNTFYEKIKDKIVFTKPYKTFTNKENLEVGVDIIFSLGGDGTLLDTLPIMGNSDIPVLGINIGHLGFLTSVGRDGISTLLEELEKKNYNIDKRKVLKVCDKNIGIKNNYALNDVCLRSAKAGDLLDISIFIDDEFLATYTADGVIITTPTGSTAYNMSAGGPIISPQTPCIGITPICPHNLTFRPIIISDTSNIRLELKESREDIILYIDSQCTTLSTPFDVEIKKSEFEFKLVRMNNQSFFDAIRKKLMWGTYIRRG
ncbi:MAG: NAD kinase [Bacteroidales bacterium]